MHSNDIFQNKPNHRLWPTQAVRQCKVHVTPRAGDITCKHELASANLEPEDKWKWHLARNSSTSTAMAQRTRGSFACGVTTKFSDSSFLRRLRKTELSSETSFQVLLGGLNREPFEFLYLLFIFCSCLILKKVEGRPSK